MRYEANDQNAGSSDHEKFGETGSFQGAAAGATSEASAGAEKVVSKVGDVIDHAEVTVRERAGQLKASLADKLETGAQTLRRRSSDTSALDSAVNTTKQKVAGASDRVATGMEQSADWLRSADMSSIQRGLEKHVKERPGRTLLIAAGIGYLLGRALKGKDS